MDEADGIYQARAARPDRRLPILEFGSAQSGWRGDSRAGSAIHSDLHTRHPRPDHLRFLPPWPHTARGRHAVFHQRRIGFLQHPLLRRACGDCKRSEGSLFVGKAEVSGIATSIAPQPQLHHSALPFRTPDILQRFRANRNRTARIALSVASAPSEIASTPNAPSRRETLRTEGPSPPKVPLPTSRRLYLPSGRRWDQRVFDG